MRFFLPFAALLVAASDNKASVNSEMKKMLQSAAAGAGLDEFAHELIAFNERSTKFVVDGTCGLGIDPTQVDMEVPVGRKSCSEICNCLEEPTRLVHSRADRCKCAQNLTFIPRYPVAEISNPALPTGCIFNFETQEVSYNHPPAGHYHHEEEVVVGCDTPVDGRLNSYRMCACSRGF
eukprot:Polyplicarium_translucidae@DN3344_c0_g2_i1.p1